MDARQRRATARRPSGRLSARLQAAAPKVGTMSGTPGSTAMTDDSTPISDGHSLEYRGFRFELRTAPVPGGYQPIVVVVRTPADEEETQLPNDTEEIVYGTEAEATRHAEQQAMRWVHDRTGDAQPQS